MTDHALDLLAGVRVVEVGPSIASSYATRLLADLGADVVKVDPPPGDPLRRRLAAHGVPGLRPGGLRTWLDAGKRSALGDPFLPDGRRLVADLAGVADVVVESLGPGALAGLGFGGAELRAMNPGLSLVSLSNFGSGGPWRDRPATELTLQAASGYPATHGDFGRAPLYVPRSRAGPARVRGRHRNHPRVRLTG